MKNWKRNKKWMRRLWNAMAYYETQNIFAGMECYFTPAKKPISGKSARRLVGEVVKGVELPTPYPVRIRNAEIWGKTA